MALFFISSFRYLELENTRFMQRFGAYLRMQVKKLDNVN